MSERMKKTLVILAALAIVGFVAAQMIINPGPEHIADTNGEDNYSLQTINEHDVISMQMGHRGGISESESHFSFGDSSVSVSSGIKYSCKKFTGVYRLNTCYIFEGSDIHVYLSDLRIKSGNFAFYVVFDGEIVGQLKPDEFGTAELLIENIEKSGTLEYIIAGESANFSFVAPTEW